MTAGPTIREAAASDVDALMRAAIASTLFEPDDAPLVAGLLEQSIGSDGAVVLLASIDDDVVGVAVARAEEATDRTWDLTLLAVDARAQRTGAGRALVTGVEARLHAQDQRLLLIRTSSTAPQTGARAFYAAVGYAEVARIPDRWADGDDDVTFWKRLARPAT